MKNLNDDFIIFQGICVALTILLIYILLIRSYFLYRKLDLVIKKLPLLNFILSIAIIIFFTSSFLKETRTINTFDGTVFFSPNTIESTSFYPSTLILILFFEEGYKYLFRILAIVLLLSSILGLIITYKKKKYIINFIPLLLGILSHFLIMLDFDTSFSIISFEVSFISIFWIILLIISTYILIKDKRKTA